MTVKLLSITQDSQELIEHAGRVCYRSSGEDTAKFIQARIRQGHISIIEHASATFELVISRACSHQLVRHRLASYSQESQRYVNMSEPEFIIPDSMETNEAAWRIFAWFQHATTWTYNELLELGIPKEDARFVLPNATATRIVVTMNFRSLRHFFRTRCDKAAQWEIRGVAMDMLTIMHENAPAVFGDLYERYVHDTRI